MMFMINFSCDECNVINLMIVIIMLEMNCMIHGLVIKKCVLKHDMLCNMWTNKT
jgi:hypothetical protein